MIPQRWACTKFCVKKGRIADEIAIGKEQEFDDVPGRLAGRGGRRGAAGRTFSEPGSGGSLGSHIYVSHVDIF